MQVVSIFPEDPRYIPPMPGGRPPTSQNRTPFGQRLFEARKQKGLSQIQIAEAIGITQPSYANWERCSVSLKPEYLPKLAKALGMSVEDLLGVAPSTRRGSGPTGKVHQIFEAVTRMPRYQQQRVIAIVEDMIAAQRGKGTS